MASVLYDRWKRRMLARLSRDTKGAAAVEFALVLTPFAVLLFGILELCFLFVAQTTLEHGVMEASRKIRTGEFQASSTSADEFKTMICDGFLGFLGCGDKVFVDVRRFSNFSSVSSSDPLSDGVLSAGEMQFDPGGGGAIVLVRVWYKWELFTPLIGQYLANTDGNANALQVSTAFRNEPFDT